MSEQGPQFQPEDTDEIIRHHNRPLPSESRRALIQSVQAERERFEANLEARQERKEQRGGKGR